MKDARARLPDEAIGFLLLRAFFSIFWLGQFFGKMFDQESGVVAWRNLAIWSANTTAWFAKSSALPGMVAAPYLRVLPYAELALGLLLALGVATRRTLICSAALLVTLDFGMLLQLKHDVVALNTIYLLAIIQAIRWERHNRWTLDEFVGAKG